LCRQGHPTRSCYCGAIEAFWKECMMPRDEGKKIPISVFQ
jgi:hypothetical protein